MNDRELGPGVAVYRDALVLALARELGDATVEFDLSDGSAFVLTRVPEFKAVYP